MHIFLQGPKRVGKSTVISRTLAILMARRSLELGGFFTWNGGKEDPHVYMKPSKGTVHLLDSSNGAVRMYDKPPSGEGGGPQGRGLADASAAFRLASWDSIKGGLKSDIQMFEQEGVRILRESVGVDLIMMDELGFLEANAPGFQRAVLETLAGNVAVFGVLRLGDVPWHEDIKRDPRVTIFDVDESNRDKLPQLLADRLCLS